ncbi:MAG: ATP-binding cassette domain-containing protein [Clostridiales Family XIII bacterium]|jgi:ABC-type multidrug transport system ATPase subunit|nr:ATP-binding cassette domain-containing protein [Clostridiales Family XIII bacterium]
MMGRRAVLLITDAVGHTYEYPLSGHSTLGRNTLGNNIDIGFNGGGVSRTHGDVFPHGDGYYYRDLGSRNGSYVNGARRLNPMEPYGLTHGDMITLGSAAANGGVGFRFITRAANDVNRVSAPRMQPSPNPAPAAPRMQPSRNPAAASPQGTPPPSHGSSPASVNVRAPKLKVNIAERTVQKGFKKITLLKDIRLTIAQGEMVMVLGGSGAGKTTLMNAIMGYERATGRIVFGQTDIYKEYSTMKYRIGYVPQQDLLRAKDTVYDTLRNAAKMKMPARTSESERRRRVLEVLKLLGLQRESAALVSKLSGGQRKRLSIAVEYIADPSLFFLDEPDSGLDGAMSKSLTQQLRGIADQGKIIMVITHSPDRVSGLYDKAVILAKSAVDNVGHLAYFGSIPGAFSFFETNSLEGVVKRINRADEGGDGKSDFYIEKYKKLQRGGNE